MEDKEKIKLLAKAIIEGEQSGVCENFDAERNLQELIEKKQIKHE